jgi:hypothetical protein
MGKVNVARLGKLHAAGRSVEDIARIFGCSERSVRRHLVRLADRAPTAVLREAVQVERAAANVLDIQEEWTALHLEARGALEELKAAKAWPEALKAVRVLQQSLDQAIRVAEMLHDWRSQAEFQTEVLDVIGGVDPHARAEIVKRLDQRRSLRLTFGRPALH